MTDRIFEAFAPLYWAAGLPVIPLRQRNKMPDINQWSAFGSRMPSEIEQQHWLYSFPKGNIGLPFGPESGLCAIDIDTEDEDLVAAILDILPKTPWVRIGKKGMGLAYRFEGQKNFKLRGADGGMILEFLGLGNQMVMPPSIHPDTGLPYTANSNLWEVKDKLPFLGEDIEDKLRALLGTKGFELGAGGRSSPIDIVPAGERDVQMIRHAGYLARVVLGIDKSTKFSLVEALGHMHHWVEQFTAKVSGDAMDPEKGVSKLLEFLARDLEKGRTLPDGWDAGLTDEMKAHPTIAELIEVSRETSWTPQKAIDWFHANVRQTAMGIDDLERTLSELNARLATDTTFTDAKAKLAFADIYQRYLKKVGMTRRDMLDLLNRARKGLDEHEAESHAKIAARVIDGLQKSGEIRFDLGQFWQWGGSRFERRTHNEFYNYVTENVTDSALVRRNSDYKALVEVIQNRCTTPLAQDAVRGVNFANGFVDEDLVLRDHDPKFGATFTLPFEYDRDKATRCPRFLEFLHSCWGDESDIDQRLLALQEMFAATLFGVATRYQRAFLLYGRAGSGKTQILNILRSMLPPDAVATLGPQEWSERFSLTDLIGKTANICGELPENGMIAGNKFKEIVEGTPQRTEFKGKDAFDFTPICAHWFASNHLPRSRDTSAGFTRRWLILDFNKPVAEKDKIEGLADIIVAEERDAIAAWAVAGLPRLTENRDYTLPICHQRRAVQIRRINNSVEAFLQDSTMVRRSEDGEIKCRDLYGYYKVQTADVSRATPVSYERFLQMLEDLDVKVAVKPDATGADEFVALGIEKVSLSN